jgi:hypothetical protein
MPEITSTQTFEKTPATMVDADKPHADLQAIQHALLQARTAMEFSGGTFATPAMSSISAAGFLALPECRKRIAGLRGAPDASISNWKAASGPEHDAPCWQTGLIVITRRGVCRTRCAGCSGNPVHDGQARAA